MARFNDACAKDPEVPRPKIMLPAAHLCRVRRGGYRAGSS